LVKVMTVRYLCGFDRPGMQGYFEELTKFVASAPSWPPADMAPVIALAERYDTFSPSE